MPRIFLPQEQFNTESAVILGLDHQHLARVLRARCGDEVTLFDNTGNAFRAVIVTIGKAETIARIEEVLVAPSEPGVHITVAQALSKSDKLEQVIQHGTEVGASAFLPIRSERCGVDVPEARLADRVQRWRLIAKGAAEQSGRGRIPTVEPPVAFLPMLRKVEAEGTPAFLLHPDPDSVPLHTALERIGLPQRLLLAVGPEGGWSPTEVSAARASNLSLVTLGTRILRTETAALVAISQIMYHWDRLR